MTIESLRASIDAIDDQIITLFESRMALVKDVGDLKKQSNQNVLNTNREAIIFERVTNQLNNKALEPFAHELFKTLMRVSKAYQK